MYIVHYKSSLLCWQRLQPPWLVERGLKHLVPIQAATNNSGMVVLTIMTTRLVASPSKTVYHGGAKLQAPTLPIRAGIATCFDYISTWLVQVLVWRCYLYFYLISTGADMEVLTTDWYMCWHGGADYWLEQVLTWRCWLLIGTCADMEVLTTDRYRCWQGGADYWLVQVLVLRCWLLIGTCAGV
jgi:hypothetical protein